jgi:hypothetical protein
MAESLGAGEEGIIEVLLRRLVFFWQLPSGFAKRSVRPGIGLGRTDCNGPARRIRIRNT